MPRAANRLPSSTADVWNAGSVPRFDPQKTQIRRIIEDADYD
jgi:hypothetical protein